MLCGLQPCLASIRSSRPTIERPHLYLYTDRSTPAAASCASAALAQPSKSLNSQVLNDQGWPLLALHRGSKGGQAGERTAWRGESWWACKHWPGSWGGQDTPASAPGFPGPVCTHSVPEQGRVTGSNTRLVALVSLVLPKLHLSNRPPTVAPLGLLSANTACRTCCVLNLGAPLPGQALPPGPAERTARGTTGWHRQVSERRNWRGHAGGSGQQHGGSTGLSHLQHSPARAASRSKLHHAPAGHSLGMKTVGTSAPISWLVERTTGVCSRCRPAAGCTVRRGGGAAGPLPLATMLAALKRWRAAAAPAAAAAAVGPARQVPVTAKCWPVRTCASCCCVACRGTRLPSAVCSTTILHKSVWWAGGRVSLGRLGAAAHVWPIGGAAASDTPSERPRLNTAAGAPPRLHLCYLECAEGASTESTAARPAQ